jgi:hypothetical protein
MRKICLALDIDHTITNSDNMKAVEWYVNKSFWIEQITAIKKQVETEGNQFILAIVTAKPHFDDICEDLLPSLSDFLVFKQPVNTTNEKSKAPNEPTFQLEGTVYKPQGQSEVRLGSQSTGYFSSFHIVPNPLKLPSYLEDNVSLAILSQLHIINKSPFRSQLQQDDKLLIADLNKNKASIFDGKYNDTGEGEQLNNISAYCVGLKKVISLKNIQEKCGILDGDIIYWDDKEHLLNAVENNGIKTIHAHWKNIFEPENHKDVLEQAINHAFETTKTFITSRGLKVDESSSKEKVSATPACPQSISTTPKPALNKKPKDTLALKLSAVSLVTKNTSDNTKVTEGSSARVDQKLIL